MFIIHTGRAYDRDDAAIILCAIRCCHHRNIRELLAHILMPDAHERQIARRILLSKESESTEIDEFMSRKSGLIDKEDFTPEQQVYYDYTCQTGDFIKTCTVPSLRLDESDLVKEKKMLTL